MLPAAHKVNVQISFKFKHKRDACASSGAFKEGETLYYENSLQQVDKILVLGIDSNQKREYGTFMALPAYNEVFMKIRHLPVG